MSNERRTGRTFRMLLRVTLELSAPSKPKTIIVLAVNEKAARNYWDICSRFLNAYGCEFTTKEMNTSIQLQENTVFFVSQSIDIKERFRGYHNVGLFIDHAVEKR
jgi:hypothetical protein